MRRRTPLGAGLLAGICVLAVAGTAPASPAEPEWSDGAPVALAPLVAAWPDSYSVSGTKSEPLYVEHITSTRVGRDFALTIEVVAQGDSALGTQRSAVELAGDGRIRWIEGCPGSAQCSDDTGLRGFLSQAALLATAARGGLPDTGTGRTLHGHRVVCLPDEVLHPDHPPVVPGLSPCFSIATGALLGHWSEDSSAFVGATLAAGLTDSAG